MENQVTKIHAYTIILSLLIVMSGLDLGCYLVHDAPLGYGVCVKWTNGAPGSAGYIRCESK